MPSDHSGSSIPIKPVPREVVKLGEAAILKGGSRLTAYGEAMVAINAAVPTLYAYWVEARKEAVARGLVTAASGIGDAFDRVGYATRQDALNTAAELLGLTSKGEG